MLRILSVMFWKCIIIEDFDVLLFFLSFFCFICLWAILCLPFRKFGINWHLNCYTLQQIERIIYTVCIAFEWFFFLFFVLFFDWFNRINIASVSENIVYHWRLNKLQVKLFDLLCFNVYMSNSFVWFIRHRIWKFAIDRV